MGADFYKNREIIPAEDVFSRQQDENRSHNASLKIPGAWHPNNNTVVSGDRAASTRDGENAATVMHVVLDESLQAGRLKRRAGDLLCGPHVGTRGLSALSADEPVYRVSCKACIKAAARFAEVKQAA